jgi:AhpD family alkylhydroperoxidase
MTSTTAPRYEQFVPDVMKAFVDSMAAIDTHGVDRKLRHLILLRASQINRCAFCVKMHTQEAREGGETSERLDRLVVWDQVSDYSPAEQAALAWTEALTTLPAHTDLGALRAALRDHFQEEQVAAISAMIGMINLWNRIGVSRH